MVGMVAWHGGHHVAVPRNRGGTHLVMAWSAWYGGHGGMSWWACWHGMVGMLAWYGGHGGMVGTMSLYLETGEGQS